MARFDLPFAGNLRDMRLPLQRAAKRFEIDRRIKQQAECVAAEPAHDPGRFLFARQHHQHAFPAHRGRPARTGAKAGQGDVADDDVLHFTIPMHQTRADDPRLALGPHDLIRRWNGSHE